MIADIIRGSKKRSGVTVHAALEQYDYAGGLAAIYWRIKDERAERLPEWKSAEW